jgi:hypothetical protein
MEKLSILFVALLLNTAFAEVCKYGSYDTPTFGCVELCELEDRSREVINTLMSNNTRIVTTNVTCEITAFDLNVCRQDFANVTEIIADKNEEIEEMKIEVSERELEIDNKDGVIDSFTMNEHMSSKYRRVSDADQRLFFRRFHVQHRGL